MKICVIGWYGSETLGDRSILLGLAKVFNDTYEKCTIYLGSLNPFFSDRCLYEDQKFYDSISPNIDIVVFNSKNKKQLQNHILKSDLLAMGGGPIMELGSLILIQFSFRYAKNNNKKTAILGCGLGPLFREIYKKMALDILQNSDLIIFRDESSITTARHLSFEYKKPIKAPMNYLHDPAIIPIGFFEQMEHQTDNKNYILINLRDFPAKTFQTSKQIDLDEKFVKMIKELSETFDEIILVPMHTFFLGHDDRLYLSKIKQMADFEKVKVVQRPPSVLDLFYLIKNASACIGMRYHSIVFQTFINGKNAIIDYTLPDSGKIVSFINLINGVDRFKPNYINLHNKNIDFEKFNSSLFNLKDITPFQYDENIFNKTAYSFSRYLKKI